ncbi:PREDICTED: histamine H3 receptor [Corvus brachyrhynchos]|uniref:histamine H3 receptor n=1 Tax=Corvus brachyrhynchos TaxID=85066 RepID=UPI0008164DDF|nr:PREDICTED: histamine H3 receptor [Corvus brachyrhynchos]
MHNSTAEALHAAATRNETWPSQSPSSEFSLGVLVLLAFLMVLLSLVTILGNILVILAFIMDRNLRHRSNYFFLNLAVSDFAVGKSRVWSLVLIVLCVFCMPLYIPYSLTGKWHLGRGICKLWLVMDHLHCTASVFNIVLISYDRFLSVTKAFLSPVLLVTYFNMHIFHNIQRRQRRGSVQDCEPPRRSSLSWRFCGLPRPGASSRLSEAEDSVSSSMRPKKESLVTDCSSPSRDYSITPENDCPVSFCAKTRSKLQQDKKRMKTLAIIVCVFAICWAPYSLLMIIRGACQGKCIHSSLYEATFWLLWINSSLNPFLYPLCHVKFRMAFLKILCPKKFATLRSGSF